MPYQIYRIGEWERVGGVEGYSTIRAYLQSGLYETEAYARKRPLASPTRITRAAATEALRSSRPAKARSTSSGLETQKHEQRKSKAPTKGVAHSHAR
jgi:hypothetical protein